ncbi:recombinase RecF [Bifidobacterium primatium]|uniref:Recombinase RecF n=2 Tax=Bifidobacterium primatium TaxID=2045438 RepID=A0A2M9HB70_9BIFI|nr:recombinase RecF [Bifidobacterium primatium]
MNIFVGNNNCGKTTVFHAVSFIESGGDPDVLLTQGEDGDVSVELEFRGSDIPSVISSSENLKKYEGYICQDSDGYFLRVMRSSREEDIVQNKKHRSLSIRNVRIYNPETKQFENPTGIDKTISALFDAQYVWADTNNDDFHDFGKTKIIGRLISDVTNSFKDSDTWGKFEEAHRHAFGPNENGSIATLLKPIEQRIESILGEQYGQVGVTFNFGLPQLDTFFKTGHVDLADNGITTDSSLKGTGLQRALALALIQVYAGVDVSEAGASGKPFLFFLDEPETFLHPTAQDRLLTALDRLSAHSQIFLTTHSPYLLRHFDAQKHCLYVFSHEGRSSKFLCGDRLNRFAGISPTWGEINYFAFNVVSVEFHNELFGALMTLLKKRGYVTGTIASVDNYLVEQHNFERKYERFDDRNFKVDSNNKK